MNLRFRFLGTQLADPVADRSFGARYPTADLSAQGFPALPAVTSVAGSLQVLSGDERTRYKYAGQRTGNE